MKAGQNQADATAPKKFRFMGGELCLDFCNSVGGKRGVRTREYLNSYYDFVSWSEQAALLDARRAQELLRRANQRPAMGTAALNRAKRLREAIYRIFLCLGKNKKPAEDDIRELNAELGRSLNRLRVSPAKNGFGWVWNPEPMELDHPLGPIARSAADLLTSGDALENIRQCRADNCGWLFLDSSKNHSRCWCDMRDCGNRAKVRRHRLRKKHSDG
jgi:predicted RNA-binding Zn ribbon-like protein